jgi:hypothetical protein
VAETATVSDLDAAAAAFMANIQELVNATDAISSRFLWEIIDTSDTVNWETIVVNSSGTWQNVDSSDTTQWTPVVTA